MSAPGVCSVCFDEEPENLPVMSCCSQSATCLECLRQAISFSMKEHMGQQPVPLCPNCSQHMHEADVRVLASEAQLRRLEGISVRIALGDEPGYLSCPVSDCVGLGWLPPGEYGKVACPLCSHTWVVERQPGALERAVVGAFGNLQLTNLRAELWKSEHTKPCPSCGARILKNGGCPHVSCRNVTRSASCSHEFFWYCLLPWAWHSPVFCILWLARYIMFWMAMISVCTDQPFEFHLSVAGLLYACCRRINSTWRTTVLDTPSDQAERNMPFYKTGRVVVWAVGAALAALYFAFPAFQAVVSFLLHYGLPFAVGVVATVTFIRNPFFYVAAAAVWYFWDFCVSAAATLLFFPITHILPFLPLLLLPVGFVSYFGARLLSPRRIIYTGNLFSNGLSCLRSALIYAFLQPLGDPGAYLPMYIAAVSLLLTLLADCYSSLHSLLLSFSPAFENPVSALAVACTVVLVLLTNYLILLHLSSRSMFMRALSQLVFLSSLIALIYWLEVPFSDPSPLDMYHRQILLTPWNNLLFKTHHLENLVNT